MAILVTGSAGFIGFHLSQKLLAEGHDVIGIDAINDYYDVTLKQARLSQLKRQKNFDFHHFDLSDKDSTQEFFKTNGADITHIVHLAAQAGVRYSLQNPHAYLASNIHGHLNMLEGARYLDRLENFVYASSSSVYGGNDHIPFSVNDRVDHPISLYAATKKSNELMSYCYSHLFGFPTVGLRFFTVYGAWGRPDMAYFIFTKAIAEGNPIKVFNHGKMKRDFTYIDDVLNGIQGAMGYIPPKDHTGAQTKVFNLGNHKTENILDFITVIEQEMGQEAQKEFLPMQDGDVVETYADIDESRTLIGYDPKTSIAEGIPHFVRWYKDFYKV